MSDGQWVEVPRGHRILTPSGYQFVSDILSQLPASVFCLPRSSSGLFRLAHALGAVRWWRNIRDYLDGCSLDSRLDDAQLLLDEEAVQVFAPSQDDAPKRNHLASCLDGLVNRCKRTLLKSFDRLSSLCGGFRSWGQFALHLSPSLSYVDQCMNECSQNVPQFSKAEHQQEPFAESLHYQYDDVSSKSPLATNKIVSVYSVGVKELYDMEVEERHNYIAGGMVHHNTTAGVIKLLKFALIGGKVCRVIGSLGFDKGIRDTILPEIKKWIPKSRLIKEKPNSQGIITRMIIRGDNGKESVISLMSGEQDDMSFEGDLTDMVWIDEPCRRSIYIASLRSLLVSNGPLFFTLTPLSEPWIYNDIFLSTDPDIESFQGSIYDALKENGGHLDRDAAESFISKIPEDERPARIFGEFKHLMGRVYKNYNANIHRIPAFQIPKTWPVYVAIDPHQRKPNAALYLAVSPEERWYICNEIYFKAGIEDFGREVLDVNRGYSIARIVIDTSSETPDWNKRETARSMLAKIGLHTALARKKNQKIPSRMMVQQALEGKDGTGEPWLFLFDTCRQTHHEFMNYVWDDKGKSESDGLTEEVKKINDELMDCLHYIVVEHPRYKTPRILNTTIKEN